MEAADISVLLARLKREDHSRTKHDSRFSKWKLLVGPNDWEEHSNGKEGVARYRVENLPKSSAPGLYELGIAFFRTALGREIGKIDPRSTVAVYLGQAENVRTRLQQYGRSGAHLPRSNSPQKGGGYFEDVFSRGYSLVFRWAPMENKADALRTEAELLNSFDYAWNKGCNGTRRPDDVLEKLHEVEASKSSLLAKLGTLLPSHQKRVGIKIKASKPLSLEKEFSTYDDDQETKNILWQIFKFNRSQPRLVSNKGDVIANKDIVCGVALGDGSICRGSPVQGRKRCAEHKGMKTNGAILKLNKGAKSQPGISGSESIGIDDQKPLFVTGGCHATEDSDLTCGVTLKDGSPCKSKPVRGRKRCEKHKGRRIGHSDSEIATNVNDVLSNSSVFYDKRSTETWMPGAVEPRIFSQKSLVNKNCNTICGVQLGNGHICMQQPVEGRVRCEEHKGLRLKGLFSNLSPENESCVPYMDSRSNTYGSTSTSIYGAPTRNCNTICGIQLGNGHICMQQPVIGRVRCEEHKGLRVKGLLSNLSPEKESCVPYMDSRSNTYGSTSTSIYRAPTCNYSTICGVQLGNGHICMQQPVKGRVRCEEHKGLRVKGLLSNLSPENESCVSYMDSRSNTYGSTSTSICGAPTRSGSFCRRRVRGNERCWQH